VCACMCACVCVRVCVWGEGGGVVSKCKCSSGYATVYSYTSQGLYSMVPLPVLGLMKSEEAHWLALVSRKSGVWTAQKVQWVYQCF